ncbi:MAG TPA: hypothetical protein VJ725_31510 [Thermoanaerobaculia bacterium]|nr:hypothetical protein [Thermoanaerobaculia bacterium]
MSSKLSVEEVLAQLEQRATFHREKEAFHAEQEIHHRDQREIHAAELQKVLRSLESFRTVSAAAVDLARPLPTPAAPPVEETLPASGRLMVSRLLRQVAESPDLEEPFGATALAAEANRRYAKHLKEPIGPRTASDVLRRIHAEGGLEIAREGRAFHEALYSRRKRA